MMESQIQREVTEGQQIKPLSQIIIWEGFSWVDRRKQETWIYCVGASTERFCTTHHSSFPDQMSSYGQLL